MKTTKLTLLTIGFFLIASNPAIAEKNKQVDAEKKTTQKAITSTLQAENNSLQAMIDSMKNAIEEIKGWKDEQKTGTIKASCPTLLGQIALLAAGEIEPEKVRFEILSSVAGDLGHDVSFGLRSMNSGVEIKRRTVLQPVTLNENVKWSDIVNAMNIAINYMEERIRLNGLTYYSGCENIPFEYTLKPCLCNKIPGGKGWVDCRGDKCTCGEVL